MSGHPTGPRLVDANAAEAIDIAASALRAGSVIAMPTDTVYGLAAALDRPEALERLYALKHRPTEKAIPVLLSDVRHARQIARELPAEAAILARRFWPGALTLVVWANDDLPACVTSTDCEGRRTVALRIPNHPVALDIIAASGGALAVTSANRSGELPALDAGSIAGSAAAPDVIVDGGRVPGGVPSTILSIVDRQFEVLRGGAVSEAALRAALRSPEPDARGAH